MKPSPHASSANLAISHNVNLSGSGSATWNGSPHLPIFNYVSGMDCTGVEVR